MPHTMTVYDKAHFVSLATDDGKLLSPLHQVLVGMLLTEDLPPPSDNAVAEMNRLYADVLARRYFWAGKQLGRDPALSTADDVLGDWETSVLERIANGTYDDNEYF